MTGPRRASLTIRRALLIFAGVTLAVAILAVPVIVGNRFTDEPIDLLLWAVAVAFVAVAVARVLAAILPSLPRRVVLELDLTAGVVETSPPGPLPTLPGQKGPTVRELVEGLDKAAGDRRVVALFATIGGGVEGLARIEEVRDAVIRFRDSGKRAVAFSETFGEGDPGLGSYYLATGFDEIVLQPSGDVNAAGVYMQVPFFRGVLEKLGVEPQMSQRYEYKSAMNTFTERKMTEPHRESLGRVVESQYETIVAGVATARRMQADEARAAIESGPLLGDGAVRAGLVDRLAYRDEVVDAVKEQAGKGADLVAFPKWWKRAKRRNRGTTVAVVYGVGGVVRGKSRFAFPTGQAMGSDTVAGALRAAREDKKVKAVLFRVDSPGGSYVASDTIWRETVKLKEAGKPVVISMGNLAGSGGYFVAMSADRIVAHRGTITGSIGVLGGKQITAELMDKIGLSADSIEIGPRADMWTSTKPYSDETWQRLNDSLDRIYEDFTAKVAAGRNMTREAVHEVAKGRIWSGADAVGLGLVDELGGYRQALAAIRELAGLDADAKLKLKEYPKSKGPLGALLDGGGKGSSVFTPLLAALSGLTAGSFVDRALARTDVLSLPEGVDGSWWR